MMRLCDRSQFHQFNPVCVSAPAMAPIIPAYTRLVSGFVRRVRNVLASLAETRIFYYERS
jgi:hypothetical protein